MPKTIPHAKTRVAAAPLLIASLVAVTGCGGSKSTAPPADQPVKPGTPHAITVQQLRATKLLTPQATVYRRIGTPAKELGTTHSTKGVSSCVFYYHVGVTPQEGVMQICFVKRKGVNVVGVEATTVPPRSTKTKTGS